MRLRLRLEQGQFARVYGPAKARVTEGQVMVLGAIYGDGSEFTVPRYRSYALKGLVESAVEMELGVGGTVENPTPGEEPLDKWVAEIDRALRRGCRGFMVLGPVDAGKSSIAALIANRALLYGHRPGVVDADVGQADIGPPACISAARVRKPILWLRSLRAERMRFVGYITPQKAERRITAGIVDLAHWLRSSGSDVIVVDTDGWVQGIQSLMYKLEAAHLAGLDTLVVVGDEKLSRMAVSAWGRRGCGVIALASPAKKRTRDRGDRRSLRSEAYRRYLSPLVPREIDLSKIMVLGSCFYSGEKLPPETASAYSAMLRVHVEAASETYDTVYVATYGQPDPSSIAKLSDALGKQVYILDKNNMRGTLVALVAPSGVEEAIGLLEEIDFARDKAVIRTPYSGDVVGIIVGGTRLSENLEDTGRQLRCVI